MTSIFVKRKNKRLNKCVSINNTRNIEGHAVLHDHLKKTRLTPSFRRLVVCRTVCRTTLFLATIQARHTNNRTHNSAGRGMAMKPGKLCRNGQGFLSWGADTPQPYKRHQLHRLKLLGSHSHAYPISKEPVLTEMFPD